jgi:hypothetical protein
MKEDTQKSKQQVETHKGADTREKTNFKIEIS